MKNFIITNPASKFGHDFVQRDDNGVETFRKEITSKTGDGYYHLPVAVNGRKLCKISHIGDKTEFCLDDLPEKSVRVKSNNEPKKSKVDLSEYYTDEEKKRLEKLQSEINKINEAAAARAKVKAEQEVLKNALKALDPDTLKALLDSLNA